MPGEVEALLTANSIIRDDARRNANEVVHQSELDGMQLSVTAWYTFIEVRLLRGRSVKYPYLRIRRNCVTLAWLPTSIHKPISTNVIFIREDIPAFADLDHLVNEVLAARPIHGKDVTVLDYLKAAAVHDTAALYVLNAAYEKLAYIPDRRL